MVKSILKNQILQACQKEMMARSLQKIRFVMEDSRNPEGVSHSIGGYVNHNEVLSGDLIIHLYANLSWMTSILNRGEIERQMYSLVVHELTHLWQLYTTDILARVEKRAKHVKASLRYVETRDIRRLVSQREALFEDLLVNIFEEGIAEYCGRASLGELTFDERTFVELYKYADNSSRTILSYWRECMDDLDNSIRRDPSLIDISKFQMEKSFLSKSYGIGVHIV